MKKLFWNLVLVCCAVGVGVGFSLRPWKIYASQKHSADTQMQAMRGAEKEHVKDLQLEAKIGTTLGREELARAHGYTAPGELPVPATQ